MKLGKRTLDEYLQEQQQTDTFKARLLNRSILKPRATMSASRQSAQPRLKFVPFEFQTEIRLKRERRSVSAMSSKSESSQHFRARPKPDYKFFQPKPAMKHETSFASFELSTTKRMENR